MFKSIIARVASLVLVLVATACSTDPDVVFEPSSSDAATSTDTGAGTDTNNPCAGQACDDNDLCTDDTCNKVTGKCEFIAATGYTCEDGNPCTTADVCSNGTCVGSFKSCSDNDPCTKDSCNSISGKCANTLVEGCAPEDPCLAMDCDDGNPCTDDLCTLEGCVNLVDNGNSCVKDACTTDHQCHMGNCVGYSVNCDDGNPCTVDSCNPVYGCQHEAASKGWLCDDGNVNTVNDQCVVGACVGTTLPTDLCKGKVCNDGNKCTDDQCNPATGKCESSGWTPFCCNNDADCEDSCLVGKCLSNGCNFSTKDCNDGNACTADSCMLGTGCVHTPIPGCGDTKPLCTLNSDCNDGNTCTADACDKSEKAWKCSYTPIAGCGTTQPEIPLTITWTKNAAAQDTINAKGIETLGLMFECHQAGNSQLNEVVQIEWDVHTEAGATNTAISSNFPKTKSLSKCKVNVVGKKAGVVVVWFARGGPKAIEGTVSYTWNGIYVSSVGYQSNGLGGYDWRFSPGADSDGDGLADTVDPSKFVAAPQ